MLKNTRSINMVYDIVCSNSVDELVKWVNERLKKGWKCEGGIATMLEPPRYVVFYQALMKDNDGSKHL